jgi:hypothetical protein
VHWRVDLPAFASIIRLHVESPRHVDSPALNELKQEVVAALLAPAIRKAVQKRSYAYQAGAKTSPEGMRRDKTTEAFGVVLTAKQRFLTHEQDIQALHAAVGSIVDEVLGRFGDRLNWLFP